MAPFTREIIRVEGVWRGLWRPGLVTNMCACSISVGTRLGLYPLLRDAISANSDRSLLLNSGAASSGSGSSSGGHGSSEGREIEKGNQSSASMFISGLVSE